MKTFLILLTMVSSFFMLDKNTWFISFILLTLILIVVSLKYRCNRAFLSFLFFSCLLGIALRRIYIPTFQDCGTFTGIVIKKSNSYVIVFDGIEKIYFKCKDSNLDLFDVIAIKGQIGDYFSYKKPIESGFDFSTYLYNSGVRRGIYSNSYTIIFNFPINVVQNKLMILNTINNEKARVIAGSLLFGTSDYGDALYNQLKSSGLLILISSSGLLVNSFYFTLTSILKKKFNRKITYILSFIIILPLLIFNIDSISILRVFISKIIFTYLVLKERKTDSLQVKCIPFFIMILLDRYVISSFSFILPMVLVFGIYFANLSINNRLKYFKKVYFYFVLVLLFIPFNLYFNNCFNVVNISINIVFIRINKILLVVLLPLCFFIKLPFLENLLALDYEIISMFNLKYLNVNSAPMNQYVLVLYYGLLFTYFYFREVKNKQYYKNLLMSILVTLVIQTIPIKAYLEPSIHFINVGQGDSTLISYRGVNVMVDTGGSLFNDIATNNLIPFLRKNKIYHLDYVYITHYDMDHYYALESLKKNFIVDNIYDYNYCPSIKFGDFELYNINTYQSSVVEENDKSLVLSIRLKSYKLIIMGDAPKSIEKRIIQDYPNLRADYLKVGHHGSNTSTCEEFVNHLGVKEAIISCGEKNMYGHPDKEVIETLKKNNIKIRRTDLEGTITYKIFN